MRVNFILPNSKITIRDIYPEKGRGFVIEANNVMKALNAKGWYLDGGRTEHITDPWFPDKDTPSKLY